MRLGEWNVTPLLEVASVPHPITRLTTEPGIYALYDSGGNLIYIGQAANLRREITQTLARRVNSPIRRAPHFSRRSRPTFKELTDRMSAYQVPSARMRHNLEALLLRMIPNQTQNNKLGTFR